MSESKPQNILPYIAGAIVLVVVVWGFSLVGSPSFNRKLLGDRNRIEDLRELQRAIEAHFEQQGKLPGTLRDLDKVSYWGRRRVEDPATKTPYNYKFVDEFRYELCATFELTSQDAELEKTLYDHRYGPINNGNIWVHDVGPKCFPFEIPLPKRKKEGVGIFVNPGANP